MNDIEKRCPMCNEPMIPLFHTELYCPACENDEKILDDRKSDQLEIDDWIDIQKDIDSIFDSPSSLYIIQSSLTRNGVYDKFTNAGPLSIFWYSTTKSLYVTVSEYGLGFTFNAIDPGPPWPIIFMELRNLLEELNNNNIKRRTK